MTGTFFFGELGLAVVAASLVAAQREVASLWSLPVLRDSCEKATLKRFFAQFGTVLEDLCRGMRSLLSPAMSGLVALALVQWAFLPCVSPLSRKMTCLALLGLFHVRFALQVLHLSRTAPYALACFWRRKTRQYIAGQVLFAGASLALLVPLSAPLRFLAGIALLMGGLLQTEEGPFQLASDPALLKGLGWMRVRPSEGHADSDASKSLDGATSSDGAFPAESQPISPVPLPSKFPLPPFLQNPHGGKRTLPSRAAQDPHVKKAAPLSRTCFFPPWEEWARKMDFLFVLALTVDLTRLPREDGAGLGTVAFKTVLLGGICAALFSLLPSVTFPRMQRTLRRVGVPVVIGLVLIAFFGGRS